MGTETGLVPAAEHDCQVAGAGDGLHGIAERVMPALQVIHLDGAGIITRMFIMHREPAQHPTDRVGAQGGALGAVVAAVALIGGETERDRAPTRTFRRGQGPHGGVPEGVLGVVAINATGPGIRRFCVHASPR